jgi:hypothetical protein
MSGGVRVRVRVRVRSAEILMENGTAAFWLKIQK